MSYLKLPLSLLLLFLSILGSGCGNSGRDYVYTGTFNPNVPQVNDYVLRDEVRILPSDSGLVIEEITDDTVRFSGDVPVFTLGEVLIQNTGLQKFARKVVSVQSSNGTTVVQTAPISLLDVFAEANIQRSELVPAEILSQLQPALPGVSVGEPFLAQGEDNDNNLTVPINFQNVLLGDKSDLNKVLANGTIYITVGLESALQIDNFAQLRRFRLVPYFEAEGRLELQASGGTSFRKKIPITHTLSYPAGAIGPLPLEAGIKLVIDADGRVAGRGSLAVEGAVGASGGVNFDGNQWTVPTAFDYNFNVQEPEIQGEVALSVSVVNPEMTLNLVGIGDAYINAAVMRAGVGLAYQTTPQRGFLFTRDTNFSVDAGVHLNLGPINLFKGELPRFNGPRIELAPPQLLPIPEIPQLPTVSLRITPGSKALNVNEKTVLRAEAVTAGVPGAIPVPVEWTSSNPSAVAIESQGTSAVVTALQAGGIATIRANAIGGGSATAQITVNQPSLSQLSIEPGLARVMASSDLQLTVKARYSDGRVFDLTHISTFSTSDTSILRVNSGGRVTGMKVGEGIVTARVGDLVANHPVEVFARRFSRQEVIVPSDFTGPLQVNGKVDLLAVAYYLDGSHRFNKRDLDWSSSNPNVVTVDDEGRVTAVGPGTATVTGVLPGTGLFDSVTLRVVRPPIRSLTISPAQSSVLVGGTVDFTVTALYADGTRGDVTEQVTIFEFWSDVIEFSSSVRGRAIARERGTALVIAGFEEPGTPLGFAEVSVDGPTRLRSLNAPAEVGTSVAFELSTEVLLGSGQRSPIDVAVGVRLRSGGAVLSGPTSGVTNGGTISLAGLAISEPGQYELMIESPGLQSAVIPLRVVSGGGHVSELLGNLFFGTVDGLSVGRLLSSRELELADGSPVVFPGANVHAHDVTTVGNFVYATDNWDGLRGYRFNPEAQVLALVQEPLQLAPFTIQALVTSDESAVVFASGGELLKSYLVNQASGALLETDSLPSGGQVATLVYDPDTAGAGFVFEVDFSGAVIYLRKTSAAGMLTASDSFFFSDLPGTDRNYPAGLAVVGDSIYLGNRVDSSPPRSQIMRFFLDRANGTLTNSGQSWDSGSSGSAGGFPIGPVDIIDYHHPVLGASLFVAHNDGVISHFQVTQAGHLSSQAQTVQTDAHPHRMVVRQTADGDFLVVSTSNGVAVFEIDPVDGTLSELTGSPFVEFGTIFGVAR